MWNRSINISGTGYLHDMLALGAQSLIRIVTLQAPHSETAQAVWLECIIEGELQAFLSQYQFVLEQGHVVMLEFTAELVENRAVDTLHHIETWDARLQSIEQVYLNGEPQYRKPPLSLINQSY